MTSIESLPKLYTELADWWPVLSDHDSYAGWAEVYRREIISRSASMPTTLLELGSGGGSNASHLKRDFRMTLVDLAPAMLEVSRELNPECEHIAGDMRTLRLGRQFDAVFIEDAILYMTSEEDLRCALRTAYEHCKPGGVVLVNPGETLETFKPRTEHGGRDRGSRSMRYLDWIWDPDPTDDTYLSVMVYVLRDGEEIRCVKDHHVLGLFGQDVWIRLMSEVGFSDPSSLTLECDGESAVAFAALRSAG